DRASRVAVVDHAALRLRILTSVGNGGVPAACVPGPGDAFRREPVANGLLGEGRRRMARGVGKLTAARRGRWNAAGLVQRLRSIDEEAVRRGTAVEYLDRPVEGACCRARLLLERAVLELGSRLLRRIRVHWRAGAYQPLVVQVGAAKR